MTAERIQRHLGQSGLLALALAAAGLLWLGAYHFLLPVTQWVAYVLLGLSAASRVGSAVSFFIYDVPKVLLLLTAIVFLVGVLRSFVTPERARSILGGKREGVGNVLAALLGVPTPFCSCSAVPLFVGFVESGVPLGVTLSFLISSPMVNEVAATLLLGLFGWRVALLYAATGLVIAIVTGWVIGRLHLEHWVEDWVYQMRMGDSQLVEERQTWADRARSGWQAVRDIVGRVWLYVVAGIAVGALIHGYVPQDFMAHIMGKNAWWSVPAAVLVAVPIYSNAAGVIPVVQALMEKGASLGTVLAFMMSVVGISLPEAIMLRRVLKWKLIAVFLGVVAVGIVGMGYLFNLVM